MNFEEGLREAGYFGTYQKKILLILFLFQFICPTIILSITYIGMSPDWECTSERNNNNTSLHFSPDKRCLYFEGEPQNCTPSYEDGFHTIAEEWNLVCSRSHLINLTQSGFFFGFLVGAFVLGKLADSIGRRKVTIIVFVCGAIVMMLNALTPSLMLFAVCRFVTGFLFAGVMAFYVLASEIVGPGQRGLVSVGVSMMFALGFVFLSLIAYVIQDWRRLMIFVSLMYIPFLTMYRSIPESPRWLLTMQEEVKARRILIEIARTNKRTLPSDFSLKCASSGDQSSAGLIALFRHKILFKRTLIMAFIWFTVCMVYYGLSLGVGSLSSNLYVSFSLSGLVEVPSNLVAYVILDKLGRKWSNIITLALGGAAALGCSFVQITGIYSGGSLQMALALLGKFSISASFCVIFAYTPELYSTDVRNLGIALCNVLARLGGIIAPVVILLDESGAGLSMLVMGMLSVIAAVLGLSVPETFNAPLPNTIHDIK